MELVFSFSFFFSKAIKFFCQLQLMYLALKSLIMDFKKKTNKQNNKKQTCKPPFLFCNLNNKKIHEHLFSLVPHSYALVGK